MVSQHSFSFLQNIVIFHPQFQGEASFSSESSDTVPIYTRYVQVAGLWLCVCQSRTALQPKPLPHNIQLLCKLPQLLLSHHRLPLWVSVATAIGHLWPGAPCRFGVRQLEQPVLALTFPRDGWGIQSSPFLSAAANMLGMDLLSASCLMFLPDVLFLLNSVYCWYLGKALALDAQSFWSCSSTVFLRW